MSATNQRHRFSISIHTTLTPVEDVACPPALIVVVGKLLLHQVCFEGCDAMVARQHFSGACDSATPTREGRQKVTRVIRSAVDASVFAHHLYVSRAAQ